MYTFFIAFMLYSRDNISAIQTLLQTKKLFQTEAKQTSKTKKAN
jgi:hypothetical protein